MAFCTCWKTPAPPSATFAKKQCAVDDWDLNDPHQAPLLHSRYKQYLRHGHAETDELRHVIVAIAVGNTYVSTVEMDNITFTANVTAQTQWAPNAAQATVVLLQLYHADGTPNRDAQWWLLGEISASPVLKTMQSRRERMSGLCIPAKSADTSTTLSGRTMAAQLERRHFSAWLGMTRLARSGLLTFRHWLSWVALTADGVSKSALYFILSMPEIASLNQVIMVASRPSMHPRFYLDALVHCADVVCDAPELCLDIEPNSDIALKMLATVAFLEVPMPMMLCNKALMCTDVRIVVQTAMFSPANVSEDAKEHALKCMLPHVETLHNGLFPFDTFVLLRILKASGTFTWAKAMGGRTVAAPRKSQTFVQQWINCCAVSLVEDADWDGYVLNMLETDADQINVHTLELCMAWFPARVVHEALCSAPLPVPVELVLSCLRGRWINTEAQNDFHKAALQYFCSRIECVSDIAIAEPGATLKQTATSLVNRLAETNTGVYMNIGAHDFVGAVASRAVHWNRRVRGGDSSELLAELCGGSIYSLGTTRTLFGPLGARNTLLAIPVPGSPLCWVGTTLIRSVWFIASQRARADAPRMWIVPREAAGTFMAIVSTHYRMSALRMRTHTHAHGGCLQGMCSNKHPVEYEGYCEVSEVMRHMAAGFAPPSVVLTLWVSSLTTADHIAGCPACAQWCATLCHCSEIIPVVLARACPKRLVSSKMEPRGVLMHGTKVGSHNLVQLTHQAIDSCSLTPPRFASLCSAYFGQTAQMPTMEDQPETVRIFKPTMPGWNNVHAVMPLLVCILQHCGLPTELLTLVANAYAAVKLPYLAHSVYLRTLFRARVKF